MKSWDWGNFNLFTTLRDLLKNLWVIFLAGVIGFLSCFSFYAYLLEKNYASSMSVAINLSGYTTNATSTSLARTVAMAEILRDVFNSDAIKNVVEKDIGEPVTATIRAAQLEQTNVVTVTVTDTSPMKAYRVLKSVYNNYNQVTDYVFNNVVIDVLKGPFVPKGPANSNTYVKKSILVCLLFMALVAFLVVVLSYYRNTVKNVSDVERLLDTRLFGAVYHEKLGDKKVKSLKYAMLFDTSFVSYDFSENFRKMAIKLENLKQIQQVNSVMITSVSENEGKSTISVNIALALASEGNRVLLVDVDLKKPSVYHFFRRVNHKAENEMNRYLKGETSWRKIMKKDPASGLCLLCGKTPVHNSADILNGNQFHDLIKEAEQEFDFVVVDTPPSGYAVDAELVSDVVSCAMLVVRQDFTDVTEIEDYLAVLNSNTNVVGCVLNDIHEIKPPIINLPTLYNRDHTLSYDNPKGEA